MIRRKQQKRFNPMIIAIAALMIVAIAGATTLIVFAVSRNISTITDSVKVANGNGVKIVVDSDAGFGKRKISFANEGANITPVLLRITYSETWSKADGTIISNISNGSNAVTKIWTQDFLDDFVEADDGWFYYEKVLQPESQVQVLTSIALSDMGYAVYNYDLNFRFESVQADAEAANTLWGKTVTVENGAATWAF